MVAALLLRAGLRSAGRAAVLSRSVPTGMARRALCAGGATEVVIPELGAESIVEGTILSLAKAPGDYVAAEEMVDVSPPATAQEAPQFARKQFLLQ